MAFDKDKFARGSSHANSDIPTLWLYTTADTQATVNTSGYFNAVAGQVKVGDVIMAHHGAGAVVMYNVLSNSGTVVDVADGLALGTDNID